MAINLASASAHGRVHPRSAPQAQRDY